MQYLILRVQLQTLHFHPKDLKFWFSKHKIPAAEQLSGWCLFGACQVLEAFGHKRRTWCLIRTSELDFCDMIKARGMQKALCRLNLGAQYQFWPTPHVCLASPSLLPFHLCLPNRCPYFCHPTVCALLPRTPYLQASSALIPSHCLFVGHLLFPPWCLRRSGGSHWTERTLHTNRL